MVVRQADVGEYRFAGGWLGQGGVPTLIRAECARPIRVCSQVLETRRGSLLEGERIPEDDLLCLDYCKWDDTPWVKQLFRVVIKRAVMCADGVERVILIERGRDSDLQAGVSAQVMVQPEYLRHVSAWGVGWLL